MKKSPEALEREFDTFFEGIGFQKVFHVLGASPNIKNADYWSKALEITVELKILNKDCTDPLNGWTRL